MSREKPKIFEYFKLKRVLALNVLILAAVAYGFSGEFLHNRALEIEIARLQSQAETLGAKNAELAALSQRFSDTSTIEREARLKLGLRKPGESVIIVQGETAPRDLLKERSGDPETSNDSNPEKWLKYFFH